MLARKNIPNLLTMLRLVLAAAFFVVLAYYKFDHDRYTLLLPAIVLFIFAAMTDWLDGLLARRWQVESKFGRIMDPFCDKVLILGALCFLAGPGFVSSWINNDASPAIIESGQVSGIYPWMVVVIIARELLVTGIRGEMEGTGHKFGANLWGKLKMILQSIVVPAVLLFVWFLDRVSNLGHDSLGTGMAILSFVFIRDILVYATIVVTVLSGLPYVIGAYRVAKSERVAK